MRGLAAKVRPVRAIAVQSDDGVGHPPPPLALSAPADERRAELGTTSRVFLPTAARGEVEAQERLHSIDQRVHIEGFDAE